MSEQTTADPGQLARVEAKLDAVLAKLEKFEQAAAGFMGGPAIARMFKAIANGPGRD